jgi:MoaA/NifB/PqqE/SkfB family radical SAM enzyme
MLSVFFGESVAMKINPSTIRLDASTVCQLKCPSCSTTKGLIAQTLGSKVLKFEDFKKIVDPNPWVRSIELSNWGEIFLNRDLLKILEYAHEKKIVLTAANGVNLNTVSEEMLEGLVKYRFGFISCSIDGASKETYKIYRKGGDFEAVLANIRKINEFKVKYRSDLPKLRWQFIAFGHNEHEVLRARQMAGKLGMEFYVKLAWDDFSPVKNKDMVRISSGTGVAGREEYHEKYGKDYLAETICSQLWEQPQINPDGRVLGCCVNYWGDYGNAFEEDLAGILNNERMNYARAMLLGKKEQRDDIPCTQCRWYKEMKKSNTWLFSRRKSIEAAA